MLTGFTLHRQQSENEEFQKIGLYIFVDIIEFCGSEAQQYFTSIFDEL